MGRTRDEVPFNAVKTRAAHAYLFTLGQDTPRGGVRHSEAAEHPRHNVTNGGKDLHLRRHLGVTPRLPPLPNAPSAHCSEGRNSVKPSLMRKRTRYSLLGMLALVAALIVAVALRKTAPPEAARLLPESDAILYINLRPLRSATHFDRTSVSRSPDYQHFVDVTGIIPERDLDAAAFALHRMDDPNGPNGPVAYSEVFEGRFDGERLAQYLGSIATSQENYGGHIVYTIPIEGRQFRIAQLGYDTLAASNMPTPEQIHEMLDRYRA